MLLRSYATSMDVQARAAPYRPIVTQLVTQFRKGLPCPF